MMIRDDMSSLKEQYFKEGIRGGVIGGPPVEHDPDTIEQLMAQVLTQSYDIKDALGNMRHQLLGPWPQEAIEDKLRMKTEGLVPNMKDALYAMMDTQRAIREHIAAISKGVR